MSDEEVRKQVKGGEVVEIPLDERLRAISVEEFLQKEFPPREQLLAPWLPAQGIVMVYAARGVGKTHFALSAAYAVAIGGHFLGWKAPKARRVLFVDGEMPAVSMQERLAGIMTVADEGPPKDFLRLITPDLQELPIPDLSEEDGQAALDRILGGAELVVLDNVSSLFRSGVENDAESWAPVQAWALGLRRRGVSTLFVHHAGKGGQQRGTSSREDVLDTVIALKRPNDYVATEGARFEVHFEKARGLQGDEMQTIEAQMETRNGAVIWTTKDLNNRLTEQVAVCLQGGLSVRKAATELGISKSTVSRHKKKAEADGLFPKDQQP